MIRLFTFLTLIAIAFAPHVQGEDGAEYASESGLPSYAYPPDGDVDGETRYRRNHLSERETYAAKFVAGGVYRQPTSLVFADARHALICTKLTGEIYQLDLETLEVRRVFLDARRQFGRLTKVDSERVIATDIGRSEIVLLRRSESGDGWDELSSLSIPGRPSDVWVDGSLERLSVSSLWGQRLYHVELASGSEAGLRIASHVDLAMCGGRVLGLVEQDAVLVLDAFGTRFCVVQANGDRVLNQGEFHEHNLVDARLIDGGKRVLFPQQLLVDLVSAVQGQITWGNVLSNNLRIVEAQRLADASLGDVYSQSQFIPVGSVGNGAGDPTSVAIHGDRLAVTIGGTSQVAMGSRKSRDFELIDVGYRPVACEFTEDGERLVVVNQFSDSVSIIDTEAYQVTDVKLGELRPPTDIERGEQLFHDSRLSHDGWMSCQSCHKDGHTNGLLSDNFTDGSYHSPKRVLSLLGQAETLPYGWTGTIPTLEEQVAFSIRSTMASDDPVRPENVELIAKYVRTLERPPSVIGARTSGDPDPLLNEQIERGRAFFSTSGCVDCHQGTLFTSGGVFDVQIHDEQGTREFNPPSLVGVSQRQNSLFHDGRAKSIRDVIVKEKHQMPVDATDEQRQDLEMFLLSL